MSCDMRFPTMWYVRPAKAQTSLCIVPQTKSHVFKTFSMRQFAYAQSDQSLCKSLEYSISVKLLSEHYLEFQSSQGDCIGSSESTHVKMPHCWKSHARLMCVLTSLHSG